MGLSDGTEMWFVMLEKNAHEIEVKDKKQLQLPFNWKNMKLLI